LTKYFKINNADVGTTSSNSNPNMLVTYYDARSLGDGYVDAFTSLEFGAQRCGLVNQRLCVVGSTTYSFTSPVANQCPIQAAGTTYSSAGVPGYYVEEPQMSGISAGADSYWTYDSANNKGGTATKR
jgi:hypothetical protein